jgi:hypothetical protein
MNKQDCCLHLTQVLQMNIIKTGSQLFVRKIKREQKRFSETYLKVIYKLVSL